MSSLQLELVARVRLTVGHQIFCLILCKTLSCFEFYFTPKFLQTPSTLLKAFINVTNLILKYGYNNILITLII